jgi:hypothetical protein
MTPEHSVSRHCGGKEEEKKGKKGRAAELSSVGLYIFRMGFVDFFNLLLIFFLNLCVGNRVIACGALFGMCFVRLFFFLFFSFFLKIDCFYSS